MVNRVDVNSVLMQMRQVKEQLRAQHDQQATQATSGAEIRNDRIAGDNLARQVERLQQQQQQVNPTQASQPLQGDPAVPDFQTMFSNAVNNVAVKQQQASELATRFEQGDPSIDLPEVMIARQKASVSFQAMTQVRNKLIEAYKDVMNMPV
jgi:flagellar hook-basal body complex protein FliE